MYKISEHLVDIRKEFEKMGMRIREENQLETIIPENYKRGFYEKGGKFIDKETFLNQGGHYLVHSSSKDGVWVDDVALFKTAFGRNEKIQKMPEENFKFLRIQFRWGERSFQFWFDNVYMEQRLKSNEIAPTDLLPDECQNVLELAKMKGIFHPEEAKEDLKVEINKQTQEFIKILNASKKMVFLKERFKHLMELEYESLVRKRENI